MLRILLFCSFFIAITLYARESNTPLQIRDSYSTSMYNAFVLQSQGKSNLAFIQFSSAIEDARKAGESPLKIIAIEQLFYWYRKYGTALNLFYKNPTGYDRIIDEYRPHLHQNRNPSGHYKS